MAKNPASGNGNRSGATRDRSRVQNPVSGMSEKRDSKTDRFVDRKRDSAPLKGIRRDILFPTEPSTIGREKIDRAIELVVSRRK